MKQKISLFLLFAFYFEVFAHNWVSIIPYPQQVEIQQGFFTFDKCTSLSFDRKNKVLQSAVKPLVEKFKTVSSFDLLNPICRNAPAIQIVLDSKMPEEGYQLSISNKKVLIKARQSAGVFYAMQSILQLLPPEIQQNTSVSNVKWQIPCLVMNVKPAFEYRGLMLDGARHYMPMANIKKMIDVLAMQKMNRFHWHLTDMSWHRQVIWLQSERKSGSLSNKRKACASID